MGFLCGAETSRKGPRMQARNTPPTQARQPLAARGRRTVAGCFTAIVRERTSTSRTARNLRLARAPATAPALTPARASGMGRRPRPWGSATRRASLRAFSFILAALIALAAAPAPATADRLVKFANAAGEPIQGYLTKPVGAGPFPAVVLLHSCLGLPSNRRAIEAALTGAGFAALFVDEFSTRGLKETCSVDFPQVLPDAFGALSRLAHEPGVDAQRIAVVGFSQGADGALAAAASPSGAAHGMPDGLAFRAAAAFYPPCANQAGRRLAIPTLIVVGGADDVTPAADCRRLAEGQSGDVRLSVYPGVGHCFDDPAFAGGKRVLGMTLSYDADAARRGMAELIAFLKDSLVR